MNNQPPASPEPGSSPDPSPGEKQASRLSPWRDVWLKPRGVIAQQLQQNAGWKNWLPAFIGGITILLQVFSNVTPAMLAQSLADKPGAPLPQAKDWLTAAVLFGPLIGMVQVGITAFFLRVLGRPLGGQAAPAALRLAVVWSMVPVACSLPLWWLVLNNPGSTLASVAVWIAQALSLWSMLLLVMMVSEVQRFSTSKGVANVAAFFAVNLLLLMLLAP